MKKDTPANSIIIPVYNAEKTLEGALRAIFDSDYRDFEVIVVDDGSSDNSAAIAGRFPVNLIRLDANMGQGQAKNTGVQAARGGILVFIDSDILVRKDTLYLINKSFQNDPELSAVTGLLSKEHPNSNFFSQYKNLYMHYNFKNLPEQADFIFTSIAAVRYQDFRNFLNELSGTEDTELGQYIKRINKKIVLDKKLEVAHLKKYSCLSFIKNDFKVPFGWAYIFLMHHGYSDILKKRRFAHASLGQIISIFLAPAVFLASLLSFYKAYFLLPDLFLVLWFFIIHLRFLNFLRKEKGAIFLAKALVVNYFDYLIMFSGIACGLVSFLARQAESGNEIRAGQS